MTTIFEDEKPRPDDQIYFYAVVCQASEPQIEKIKKTLVAQNARAPKPTTLSTIYTITHLAHTNPKHKKSP